MIPKIHHRPQIRSLHLNIVVDSVYPEIQQDIHFRAFSNTDQFMDFGNRKEIESAVFLAGITVSKNRIFCFPVQD